MRTDATASDASAIPIRCTFMTDLVSFLRPAPVDPAARTIAVAQRTVTLRGEIWASVGRPSPSPPHGARPVVQQLLRPDLPPYALGTGGRLEPEASRVPRHPERHRYRACPSPWDTDR